MPNIKCKSLSEVRSNIDQIDKLLVKLIAERSFFVDQAVHFKKTQSEVEAPNRVEEVIQKVRNLADIENINPNIIEQVYRTMITAFIDQEKMILNRNE